MGLNNKIYKLSKKAIKKWGKESQVRLAVGEMGELLELFGKEMQKRSKKEDWTDEIADVYMLLPALVLVYTNREDVEERIEEKIEKLEKLLEEGLDKKK